MAPLAGPVVAGAVILPQNYKLRGLNDSKKILDHGNARRTRSANQAGRSLLGLWLCGSRRDRQDKHLSRRPAGDAASGSGFDLRSRFRSGRCAEDSALPDAATRHHSRRCAVRQHCGGFNHRQDHARRPHAGDGSDSTPGYGFASHKGYPTPEHCRALKELGALPIHRRSFARGARSAWASIRSRLSSFAEPSMEDAIPASEIEHCRAGSTLRRKNRNPFAIVKESL